MSATTDDRLTQSLDGRPHLTYYAEGVSFVWSGSIDEPIEVCPGGYGEPVADRIRLSDARMTRMLVAERRSLLDGVATFRLICDAWLSEESDDLDADMLRDEAAAEANTDGRW